MSRTITNLSQSAVITLIGAVLFIPFLGQVHLFDWDEINFAESAREMLVTGNYSRVQINYQPFWEKPPLFFWLQALSMSIFGVNEFAARFPVAVCGIVTLNCIYFIGRRHFSPSLAGWWVLAYLGSFTPHFYFKTGLIDPLYNLFIFLAIYQLYLASISARFESKRANFIYSGLFTGLAILTKGPVALIIIGLCGLINLLQQRLRPFFNGGDVLAFIITVFVISFAWFGPETIANGPWLLQRFIQYQVELFSQGVAGHAQPFWYHFVVLLIGCFPVSVIAMKGFKKRVELDNSAEVIFKRWMKILFWVVLILFSIVKTKIVHYSSLCWLPLTFLAAFAIDNISIKRFAMESWLKVLIFIFGLLLSIGLVAVPLILSKPDLKVLLLANIADPFAKEGFAQDVYWAGWEWLIGVVYFLCVTAAIVAFWNEKLTRGFLTLLISTALIVQTAALVIAPKIEQYSQAPVIRFYESLQGKDVYIETVAFKSYAQYFYTRKTPSQVSPYQTIDSLLTQPISKPAYFVTKINRQEGLDTVQELKKVGAEGGFVFYRREP